MASNRHSQDRKRSTTEADVAHRPIFDPTAAMKLHVENADIEPAAFALYEKYLSEPMLPLCGPTDQRTSEYYMQLYILSLRLSDEKLQNNIMDLVRRFYACDRLSASPSRLEYIYQASITTPHPENVMKRFLIMTAAFRALAETTPEGRDSWGRDVFISNQIKALLGKDKNIMEDMLDAVVNLHRNDMPDVRIGGDCAWHVHQKTKVCAKEFGEAWKST